MLDCGTKILTFKERQDSDQSRPRTTSNSHGSWITTKSSTEVNAPDGVGAVTDEEMTPFGATEVLRA